MDLAPRAGQVLTAGDLRRLRKALRAVFAALENRVGWVSLRSARHLL